MKRKVKLRFRIINDLHLDILALILLVLGLVMSAVDHLASEHKVSMLQSEVQKVHSFEVKIAATASANWLGGKPPDIIPVGFDQTKSIAALDIDTSTIRARRLELIPWLVPKLSPNGSSFVNLTLQLRARPEDWVYVTDMKDLREVRRVEFGSWGLIRSLTTDGRLYISYINLDILVNGKSVVHIRKDTNKWFELPQEPTRYGSISWNELYLFQQNP